MIKRESIANNECIKLICSGYRNSVLEFLEYEDLLPLFQTCHDLYSRKSFIASTLSTLSVSTPSIFHNPSGWTFSNVRSLYLNNVNLENDKKGKKNKKILCNLLLYELSGDRFPNLSSVEIYSGKYCNTCIYINSVNLVALKISSTYSNFGIRFITKKLTELTLKNIY